MSSASGLKLYFTHIFNPAKSRIGQEIAHTNIEEINADYIPALVEHFGMDNASFSYTIPSQNNAVSPIKKLQQKTVKFFKHFIDIFNPKVNLINLDHCKKPKVIEKQLNMPKRLSETILTALLQCKNLTYNCPNLKLMKDYYGSKEVYDLGLRFAIVAHNTAKESGHAYYIKKVPEIFYGIEHKELCQKLDILNLFLKPDKVNKFSIGGKDYTAKFIGQGCNNDVYLIENNAGNKVCLRINRYPYNLSGYAHDIYSEVAINLEAQKAGVKDISKLYMTNPIGTFVKVSSNKLGYKVKGGWQIVEYVDKTKINPQEGITLEEWLNSKGLFHSDSYNIELQDSESNIIGNTIVDLGGIQNFDSNLTHQHGLADWLINAYNHDQSSKDILKHYIN